VKQNNRQFISHENMKLLIKDNAFIYDKWFDENYAKSIDKNIFRHIDTYYFRCEYHGFETLPERNNPHTPLIFVGNHSGMTFPWDGIIFNAAYYRMSNYTLYNALRTIIAPQLAKMRIMNAFLVPKLWLRAGGIAASTINFETMMNYEKSNIFVYPEGVPGIGKGFNNKYKIQRFATSFIRMSLKYQTDIIPIACVNGEYINPYSYTFPTINKFIEKYLGIPFLPISWMIILLPFCPWLFYFAWPAKLKYVKGEVISPYKIINKPFDEISQEEIELLRDKVQAEMQSQLDRAVAIHEKNSPFYIKEFIKILFSNPKKLMFTFSPTWPLLFDEHERQYACAKNKKDFVMKWSYLKLVLAFFKNPKSWAFFIPVFGWIFIIYRGYISKKAKTNFT
jgi:1-acyl-sn-glycerol-3-phosphate acyltransferase